MRWAIKWRLKKRPLICRKGALVQISWCMIPKSSEIRGGRRKKCRKNQLLTLGVPISRLVKVLRRALLPRNWRPVQKNHQLRQDLQRSVTPWCKPRRCPRVHRRLHTSPGVTLGLILSGERVMPKVTRGVRAILVPRVPKAPTGVPGIMEGQRESLISRRVARVLCIVAKGEGEFP